MSLDFNKFKNQVTYEERIVLGALPFHDFIDGKEFDVCNVFVVAPFDSNRGGLGFGTAKIQFGKSENINQFVGVQFPETLQLGFQEITSGSGKSKKVLVSVRRISAKPSIQTPIKE